MRNEESHQLQVDKQILNGVEALNSEDQAHDFLERLISTLQVNSVLHELVEELMVANHFGDRRLHLGSDLVDGGLKHFHLLR